MRTPSDGMRMQVRSSSMLLSRTTTEMKAEIIWVILRKFAENNNGKDGKRHIASDIAFFVFNFP